MRPSLQFCWMWIFPWIKCSWHSCSIRDKFGYDSIDSGNFSVRVYLLLFWKDSITHMHSVAVYVKQWLPFAQDFSQESSSDSYICFWLALLHSLSYSFYLYWSPSLLLCIVFDSISSKIDEILSINSYANVFVFGDSNIHHKDWLNYSGVICRPG